MKVWWPLLKVSRNVYSNEVCWEMVPNFSVYLETNETFEWCEKKHHPSISFIFSFLLCFCKIYPQYLPKRRNCCNIWFIDQSWGEINNPFRHHPDTLVLPMGCERRVIGLPHGRNLKFANTQREIQWFIPTKSHQTHTTTPSNTPSTEDR